MAYLIDSDIMVDFTRGGAEGVDYLQNLGPACRIGEANRHVAGAHSTCAVDSGELSVSYAESVGCVVRPERLELPTCWFEARRSIQLSYGRTPFVS